MRLDRDKLIRARELLGYGIEKTAEEAGVSKNSVLRAEHEEDIRPLTARKISAALGVRVADLIGEFNYQAPKAPASIEELLDRAGVGTRWAAMSDEEWNEILDIADAEEALRLCYAVADERVATQEVRWDFSARDRTLEEKRIAARMLSNYFTREAQAANKSGEERAAQDAKAAIERELVGAGR